MDKFTRFYILGERPWLEGKELRPVDGIMYDGWGELQHQYAGHVPTSYLEEQLQVTSASRMDCGNSLFPGSTTLYFDSGNSQSRVFFLINNDDTRLCRTEELKGITVKVYFSSEEKQKERKIAMVEIPE